MPRKTEHRDQHGAPWPARTPRPRVVAVTAPEVVAEHPGPERDDRHQDEHHDRHDLGDSGDPVDDRRLPRRAGSEAEQPHPTEARMTAGTVSPAPKAGNSALVVAAMKHPVGGVARAGRRPEPECRVEADVVTETGLGVRRRYPRRDPVCGWQGAGRRTPASACQVPAMAHMRIKAQPLRSQCQKRRGSRKTPDPIIDQTTMAVSVGRLTLSSALAGGESVVVIAAFPGAAILALNRGCGSAKSSDRFAPRRHPAHLRDAGLPAIESSCRARVAR